MPILNPQASCANCGAIFARRSPSHIYCATCSEKRDLERKKLWARKHPPRDPVKQYRQEQNRLRQRGSDISQENRHSITWIGDEQRPLLWIHRVSVPFDYAYSKNHIYTMRASGHVALRESARSARTLLTLELRSTIAQSEITIVQAKLWIDILVQKSNHKGDAINVIDTVSDAIKDAVGLDDRWFCIRRLDWEIVKTEPRIYVGIAQDTDVPVQVCSYCGRSLPYEMFSKRTNTKNGIGRECKDCSSQKKQK